MTLVPRVFALLLVAQLGIAPARLAAAPQDTSKKPTPEDTSKKPATDDTNKKPAKAAKQAAEETQIKPIVHGFDVNSPDWTTADTGGKALIAKAVNHPETREDVVKALAKLPSTTRWVDAGPGQLVVVYSFYRSNTGEIVRVKVDENEREPLVAQQLRDVLKVAQNVSGGLQTTEATTPPIQISQTPYTLQLHRAEVQFTGTIQKADTNSPEPKDNPRWIVVLDFTAGGKDTNAATATITTLTGPREAWSFSANAPIGQLKQLKLDDKAESLGLKDKPGEFYVSFNYLPRGDALLPPHEWADALQFLAMLKTSKRPTDSYGFGIGLRPGIFTAKKWPSILQIFDTITPFAAVTRTRLTGTDASGATQTGHRTDLVLGLSLDIKKGVEWTTKKSDGEKK